MPAPPPASGGNTAAPVPKDPPGSGWYLPCAARLTQDGGFLLGTPGSGKSALFKRHIVAALRTQMAAEQDRP
jgi:hypothetical protein